MPKQDLYYNSYDECRNAFLQATQEIKSLQSSFESIPVNTSQDGLFTDIAYFKNKGKNPLVIITSGLHGIEGYVGSALQLSLLKRICSEEINISGIDLLFAHAINPWGFKNNRRVTSNNVDLNRNFSLTNDLFQVKNTGYSKIRLSWNPITCIQEDR